MKKTLALLLAMLMLLLCACKTEDVPDLGDINGTGPAGGTSTDKNDAPGDGGETEENVTAIGVANRYEEIDANRARELFGDSLNIPVEAENLHWFDIDIGSGARMLQVQFVIKDVQYILRCKAADRLTNISAAYATWDVEKEVDINGCTGQFSQANGGAASLMWFDAKGGYTYALSAAKGATEGDITDLARRVFAGGSGETGGDQPEDNEDNTPADPDDVPPPPEKQPVSVRVYYPAGDGVSFSSVLLTTDALDEHYLIERLIGLGVLGSNVEAQWLEGMTIDENGGTELALSLSEEFGTQLKNCSAQKEHMLMGSIVNTFLEAYSASRIWIYVDGDDPVSATRTYSEPLTKYGPYDPDAEEEAEEEEKEEDIPEAPAPDLTVAQKICELAKSKVGAQYVYGAAGPDTFDNSGFVYYCFKENGIDIPRRTTKMYESGTPVAQSDLQPGDLVFFTYEDDRSPSYVGIYLGDGKFIAENNENAPVTIMDMTTKYFQDIYIGARRYT